MPPPPYHTPMTLKKPLPFVFIVDIDGTLADNSHRLPKLKWTCVACGSRMDHTENACASCGGCDKAPMQESFDDFMDSLLLVKDAVVPRAQEALQSLRDKGAQLVFLTGRSELCRGATEQWLATNNLREPSIEPLYMRSVEYDGIPASEYKEAQVIRLKQDHPHSLFFFAEDDQHVFSTLKKYGIVLKAPECWTVWNPDGLVDDEPAYKV